MTVVDEVDNSLSQPMPGGETPAVGAEPRADHAPPAEPHAAEQPPDRPAESPRGDAPVGTSAEAQPAGEPQPEVKSEPAAAPAAPNGRAPAATEPAKSRQETSDGDDEEIRKEWYILKVQSNREESIKEGLMRRVRAAGLDRFFGECIVPTEMVSEFKGGKKRVTKRKLYPGYLVVHMAINDDTWYLVRETTGIGDFTGSVGRPTPMLAQDVQKILSKSEEKTDEAPKLKISFKKGDRVKINEGTFENFEGDVDTIDEGNGRVSVMINIFGRSTPVELEYWQIEAL
jgi:transcription termination/antitermination protein NusG